MKQKTQTKPQKKSRGMAHFIDLSEDFPPKPLETKVQQAADEENVVEINHQQISNLSGDSVSPPQHKNVIEESPEKQFVPKNDSPVFLESVKPKLEDLVVVPQAEKLPQPQLPEIQRTREEIKQAVEYVAPAPTRTREEAILPKTPSISNFQPEQTNDKPLAGSFEIPDEERLDKGYHFYCNERVLDKVRRYAKQKNITISKLITTILDKAIKEE